MSATYENNVFCEEKRMAIAYTLRDLRERNGLSQRDVAKFLFVTDSTISHYEKGISIPSIENVIRLAKLYEVSVDYLLNNCTCRINYSKILDTQLTNDMSLGKAVEIVLSASKKEKQLIASLISYIGSK